MSDEIRAIFGKVTQVRDYPSQQVTKIVIEIPIEAHVTATQLVHGRDVLLTLAPDGLKRPYGLVLGAGDGVDPPEPEITPPAAGKPRGGALSQLAGKWCRRTDFQKFLRDGWPNLWAEARVHWPVDGGEELARDVVVAICGIHSRAELDHDPRARRVFDDVIRHRFGASMEAGDG
jgi:hypothetical protein